MSNFVEGTFKVSFTNEKYYVRKNIVVCKMDWHLQIPEGNYFMIDEWSGVFKTRHSIGKSTCADCDKFDETIGRRIARTRAEDKAYTEAVKIVKRIVDAATEFCLLGGVFANKANSVITHNSDYLKRLDDKVICKRKAHPCERKNNDFEKAILEKPVSEMDKSAPIADNAGKKDTSKNENVAGFKYCNDNGKVSKTTISKEEALKEWERIQKDFDEFDEFMGSIFI